MSSELEEYESQLEAVRVALNDEPDNEDLIELQKELLDVITLLSKPAETSKELEQSSTKPSAGLLADPTASKESDSIKDIEKGDIVLALHSKSNEKAQAKVLDISGPPEARLATISYIKHKTTETLRIDRLDLHSKKPRVVPQAPAAPKVPKAPAPPKPPAVAGTDTIDDSIAEQRKTSWQAFQKTRQTPTTARPIGGIKKQAPKRHFRKSN